MRKYIPVLAVLAVIGASNAHAASFDCAKATTADEKTICRNRSLSDSDVKMATMFSMNTRLVMMGSRGNMQDRQREWVAERNTCKGRFKCLTAVYAKRISELQADFDGIASRGPF
ncbi:hypothetical protein [Asticcacaulis sp.]|uniref:lysozyme inhibitor LprI family protein n=1 Tax=Asticcacaulis sp. TaxID=1872648 RepID=UPI002B8CAF5E|nr:hypothetical protein [Asticcacaulis sp.]HTM80444.1 hypothetical protein [Asticcacaulis sp.]